jgi:hypothetical protein
MPPRNPLLSTLARKLAALYVTTVGNDFAAQRKLSFTRLKRKVALPSSIQPVSNTWLLQST